MDSIKLIFQLIWALILTAGVAGWTMNIIKFVHIIDAGLTGMFIARIVGVFAFPLGGVLGFF